MDTDTEPASAADAAALDAEADIEIELDEPAGGAEAAAGAEEGDKPEAGAQREPVRTPEERRGDRRERKAARYDEAFRRAAEAEAALREERDARLKLERRLAMATETGMEYFNQSAEKDVANAKAKLRQAKADGDIDAEVEAQAELAAASATAARARVLRDQAKRPAASEDGETEQPQRQSRPAAGGFTERTAQWMGDNGHWFQKDQGATAVAMDAHNRAIKAGHAPDTDEYFAMINGAVRKRYPEYFEDDDAAEEQRPAARRDPAFTAPVGGRGGTSSPPPNGRMRITLTPDERSVARSLRPDLAPAEAEKLYGANKAARIKSGDIKPRSTYA